MRRFESVEAITPATFRRPAVTIGVFDGMHRGHRHVIEHLRAMADRLDGEAVVITFETHPRALLEGAPPRRILSLAHRLLLLERLGVDAAVVLPFDGALREQAYDDFTRDVLVARLRVRGLLFGYNTSFGRGGKGTRARLEPLGRRHGFEVAEAPPIALRGEPISSSRIRDAIERGDLDAAAEMLGRPPALYGHVVRGAGRGRALGFPTANVDPEGEILPPRGVYQVVATLRGERYVAAANVGVRPTFGDVKSPVLEIHVPGVDFDFYGERVEVEIVRKIREERAFPSREALVRQIREDVASLGASPS